MSLMSLTDKIQGNVSKANFRKSPPPGKHWKSKSMRVIPEEFVRRTQGAFEHRVVCSVRWGNSWQFWLEREKKGLVIDEEDWDEFVDRNLLGPNDVLIFTHEDSMFLQLRIYKSNGEEIISAPVKPEPKTEPVHHPTPQFYHQEPVHPMPRTSHQESVHHPAPQYSHQEPVHPTTPAFASVSAFGKTTRYPTTPAFASQYPTTPAFASASSSASGVTYDRAKKDSGNVKNPERYLLNPKSPYFVKTLTKRNDVLYVPKPAILKYGLKFGPTKSPMTWILPEGKLEGFTKIYGNSYCFNSWTVVCKRHNLTMGDSVVCELELSGGVVSAVRVHFPKE